MQPVSHGQVCNPTYVPMIQTVHYREGAYEGYTVKFVDDGFDSENLGAASFDGKKFRRYVSR